MIGTPPRGATILKASVCSPFLVLLLCANVFAQERQQNKQHHSKFDVTWGGKTVGKVQLQRACPDDGNVKLGMTAVSRGLIQQMYDFNTRFRSVVPTDFSGTSALETYIVEKGTPRLFQTFRTQHGFKVKRTYKKKITTQKLKLPNHTQDFISWLYALRGTDLTPGKSYSYFVWDGWKLTQLDADVMKPGAVFLPYNDATVDTVRVKIHRTVVDKHDVKTVLREREKLGVLYFRKTDLVLVGMDYDAALADAKIRMTAYAEKRCP